MLTMLYALTLSSCAINIPETDLSILAFKVNNLTLVKGNQFDGRTKTDPHKHIHEFLGICDKFKYRDTENEVVRLMMFPLSLTGKAILGWTNISNEGTIEAWDVTSNIALISGFLAYSGGPTLSSKKSFMDLKSQSQSVAKIIKLQFNLEQVRQIADMQYGRPSASSQ
ncbi:hypothetical protein Tco_1274273 [Tanacetum coccineum]